MDIDDLRIFKTVVEEGSVTRAANRLHRVQSNVTTRIQQLEEDLGVPLFLRQGKKLHLSPKGSILKDYADRLLSLSAEAREAVYDSKPRGLLRLGSMESIAITHLPGALSKYLRAFPDVKLELSTGLPEGIISEILKGELDAGLVTEPIDASSLDKLLIYDEELVIVKPKNQKIDSMRTIVASGKGCFNRQKLEDWFRDNGKAPDRIIEMSSYHTILGCVLIGMGMTLLPRIVLNTFPERKRLDILSLPPGKNRAHAFLAWRKGALSPKITALIKVLKNEPYEFS